MPRSAALAIICCSRTARSSIHGGVRLLVLRLCALEAVAGSAAEMRESFKAALLYHQSRGSVHTCSL